MEGPRRRRGPGCGLALLIFIIGLGLGLGLAYFFLLKAQPSQDPPPGQEDQEYQAGDQAREGTTFWNLEDAIAYAQDQVAALEPSFSFRLVGKDLLLETEEVNQAFHGAFTDSRHPAFIYYNGFKWSRQGMTYQLDVDYYPGADPQATREAIGAWISETGILGLPDEAKVKAIHDYIIEKNDYNLGQDEGQGPVSGGHSIYIPESILFGQGGVCQAYASLFLLMAQEVGLEARFVVGQARGEDHAWNMVKVDGTWYHIDVTWDDPVGNVPIIYDHYLVSTATIQAQDHIIEEGQDLPLEEATHDYDHDYSRKSWFHFSLGDLDPESQEAQDREARVQAYKEARHARVIAWEGRGQEDMVAQVREALASSNLASQVLVVEVGDLDLKAFFEALKIILADLRAQGLVGGYSMISNNSGDYIVIDNGDLGRILDI